MVMLGGAVSLGSFSSSPSSRSSSSCRTPALGGEHYHRLRLRRCSSRHISPAAVTPSGLLLRTKRVSLRIRSAVLLLLLPLLLEVVHARWWCASSDARAVVVTPSNTQQQPQPQHSTVHRPKRGQVLQDLTPQSMCDAYRAIQHDYQRKAFAPSTKWHLLSAQDGVQVSLLHHPSDPTCPYVKMTGIIPASVQDCWNFLLVSAWEHTMPKMDPFYEGVTTYGEYRHRKVHMILCRKRTQRILAFGKRDLVFLSVQDEPLPDGTWVSGTVSVVTPRIPRQPGYTRAFQDSIAFYKPLQGNTQTQLTIVCRMDLNDSGTDGSGGHIPMWLYVKTIGYTAVQSVIRMRNAIVEDVRERELQRAAHQGEGWNPFQFHRGWFPSTATAAPPGPDAAK